jgi:hypothetical protein
MDKAILDARTKYSADVAAGADAATLAADQTAIDQAVQANADYQKGVLIAQEQQDLADKQKRDKDNFEAALSGLEKQAQSANTEAKVKAVQAKIAALFKKYGITPGSVEAGADWNAAQSLFVAGMGDLNKSMQALITALDRLSSAKTDLGVASGGGGMPHLASGGPVPIIAHAGEYVVRADAVKKLGGPVLNYMNRTGNLPHYAKGGKINPTTGLPDDPAYRAAAPYLNDYGYDRNQVEIGTALAGLLGPRAQAQAMIRATYVNTPQGRVDLRHGYWRASGGVVDSKMLTAWGKQFPGITFEPGTPGQQISWMQAASRLPAGGQELGSLIAASVGPTGTGAHTHGSLVEMLTSHAVHFAKGGLIPAMATGGSILSDGLLYGHKGERVMPAKVSRGGGDIHLHATIELDGRKVGQSVQRYLGEVERWGGNGIPR